MKPLDQGIAHGRDASTGRETVVLEFDSARAAGTCAPAIRRTLTQDDGEPPAAPLRVRTGLHDGDAVEEALGADSARAPSPAAARSVFRREGDVWRIEFDGRRVCLKDRRGLQYLALLLRHPGREIHSIDLMAVTMRGEDGAAWSAPRAVGAALRGGDLVVSTMDGADTGIDARAWAQYRERLEELRDDLAEARANNDLGKATRVRGEIEALSVELSRAAGRRRVASAAERARLAVTKGLGAALDLLRMCHPALGRHLSVTVRRGYFCAYRPDPRVSIGWEA